MTFRCLLILIIGVFISFQSVSQEPGKATFDAGDGFRITSKDSMSYLKMSVRMQNLLSASTRIDQTSDWSSSLLIRRFRLKFDGYVVSPKVVYKIELGFSGRDISPSSDFDQVGKASKVILDAVVKWKMHRRVAIWAGQTKLPGNRERLISSQSLQFVDRSLVNSRFNIDRDIGLQLHTNFKIGEAVILPVFSWAMGEGRDITAENQGGFDYTVRLDVLPLGKFKKSGDYVSADIYKEDKPKIAIGAAFDFNDGASRQRGQLGNYLVDTSGNFIQEDLTTFFADLIFKYKGFSVQGEYANKTSSADIIDANGRGFTTGDGFNVQLGYILPKNYEIAARLTSVTPDNVGGFDETNEYTLGLSKYVNGHKLKVQSDLSIVDNITDAAQSFRFRIQVELGL